MDQFRLRNPKLDDLGEVIFEGETMDSYYLFDEKEIFLQKIVPDRNFESISHISPHNAYYIIMREWNPETWQLGPIYEVKIDKMI